jgi:hypothetical protein
MLDQIGGVNVVERGALISATFDASVASGMDPLVAFRNSMKDFLAQSQLILNQPQNIPNLPDDTKLRDSEGRIRSLDTWTAEDVDIAEGEMIEVFSGKPSLLALSYYKLEVIREYIRQKPTPEELIEIEKQVKELDELGE